MQQIKRYKNALYFSVDVISSKVLIGDTIFFVPCSYFMWTSKPREGTVCRAKTIPSFLSYLIGT